MKTAKKDLVYGINAVLSCLESSMEHILNASVVKGREEDKRIKEIIDILEENGTAVSLIKKRTMDEITGGAVHQGILLEIRPFAGKDEHDLIDLLEKHLKEPLLFLVLDGVTDSHNIGACMRSAWAAGCSGVIVPKDRSAALNAGACKAASGAIGRVPFFAVTNLSRTLKSLKDHNIKILGLDGQGKDFIYQAPMQCSCALVMGSEKDGMRHLTAQNCDGVYKIPMVSGVESLNVSVAAGIALFEAVRQRLVLSS